MRRGAQGHAQLKLLLWRGDWGVERSCRVRRRVHRGSMNRGKRNDGQPSRSSSTRTTTNKAPPRTKPTQSPRSCFNVRRAPSSPRRDGHDHQRVHPGHAARGAVKRYTSRSRAWRAQSIKTTPLPFSPSFCEQRPQQMGRTNKLGTRRGKAAPYHEGARCVSHKHGHALLGDDLAHKGSRVLTPIERCRSLSLVVKAPVLVAGGEGATTMSTTRQRRAPSRRRASKDGRSPATRHVRAWFTCFGRRLVHSYSYLAFEQAS